MNTRERVGTEIPWMKLYLETEIEFLRQKLNHCIVHHSPQDAETCYKTCTEHIKSLTRLWRFKVLSGTSVPKSDIE